MTEIQFKKLYYSLKAMNKVVYLLYDCMYMFITGSCGCEKIIIDKSGDCYFKRSGCGKEFLGTYPEFEINDILPFVVEVKN